MPADFASENCSVLPNLSGLFIKLFMDASLEYWPLWPDIPRIGASFSRLESSIIWLKTPRSWCSL